ncbi:MAG: GGDEF domain-containing protein [Fusobacteriota bacterium]
MKLKNLNIFIFIMSILTLGAIIIRPEYKNIAFVTFTFLLLLFTFIYYLLENVKTLRTTLFLLLSNESLKLKPSFFKEINDVKKHLVKIHQKQLLLDAIILTISQISTTDDYYKKLSENIGLLFNSYHFAFLQYNTDSTELRIKTANGNLKGLKKFDRKNLENYFKNIQDSIFYSKKDNTIFDNDIFYNIKRFSLFYMERSDFRGFLIIGKTKLEGSRPALSERFLNLEIQNSFILHIDNLNLKKKIKELDLLNKLTSQLEKNKSLDEGIHTYSTYITAQHGLGFNRVIFFKKIEHKLYGYSSVGSLNKAEAERVWKELENCPMDLYNYVPDQNSELTKLISRFSFDLNKDHLLADILSEKGVWKGNLDDYGFSKETKDQLKKLNLGEFILTPISSYDNVLGLVLADNAFDGKFLSSHRLESLKRFTIETSLIMHNLYLYNKVKSLATQDKLTGLYNRHFFEKKMSELFKRSERYGTPFSLILIDIDHFKDYNDNNGHVKGDELLEKISKIFTSSVRETDFVCRYGGEEFAIILPSTKLDDSYFVAKDITKKVEEFEFEFEEDQPSGNLTISSGVSTYHSHLENYTELISNTDEALYFSKENGRNQVTKFIHKNINKIH